MKMLLSAALAAFAMAGAVHAAGDVASGEKIFGQRCKTCHMLVDAAGANIVKGGKTGPNLWGVIGRTAGVQADFARYGDSLKAAGAAGLAWDEAEMVAYLEDPKKYLAAKTGDAKARSNMAYKLPDAAARADVAAYLATMK